MSTGSRHLYAAVILFEQSRFAGQGDGDSIHASHLPDNEFPENVEHQVDDDVSDLGVLGAYSAKDIRRDDDGREARESEDQIRPEDQMFGGRPGRSARGDEGKEEVNQDQKRSDSKPSPARAHFDGSGDEDVEDVTSGSGDNSQHAEPYSAETVGLSCFKVVASSFANQPTEESSIGIGNWDAGDGGKQPLDPRCADEVGGVATVSDAARLLDESVVDLEDETDTQENEWQGGQCGRVDEHDGASSWYVVVRLNVVGLSVIWTPSFDANHNAANGSP